MKTKLFDSTFVGTAQDAVDFITNILESSTEYSVIAKDLEGKILLWNEGARRLYGYEPEEVVGKANSSILHVPEDIEAGKPREILGVALRDGKWEGTVNRLRKNGQRLTARLVITPRRLRIRSAPKGWVGSSLRVWVPTYSVDGAHEVSHDVSAAPRFRWRV